MILRSPVSASACWLKRVIRSKGTPRAVVNSTNIVRICALSTSNSDAAPDDAQRIGEEGVLHLGRREADLPSRAAALVRGVVSRSCAEAKAARSAKVAATPARGLTAGAHSRAPRGRHVSVESSPSSADAQDLEPDPALLARIVAMARWNGERLDVALLHLEEDNVQPEASRRLSRTSV